MTGDLQTTDIQGDVESSQEVKHSPQRRIKTMQDDDFALAKALQDQENAFLMLAEEQEAFYRSAAGEQGQGLEASTSESELDDEELARRLQAEEHGSVYARMMEMAGLNPEQPLHQEGSDPDNLSYEVLSALGDCVGKVSKGIDPSAAMGIEQAPYAQLHNQRLEQGCTVDDMCCICRMDFDPQDCCRSLPCRHTFHSSCILMWLADNKVCPMCNTEVTAASQ